MSCDACEFPFSLCQCPVTITLGELATLRVQLKEAEALLGQIRTVVGVAESCGGSDEEDKVSAYIGIRTLITRAAAQTASLGPPVKP